MSVSNVLFVSIDSLRRDFLGAYDQPVDLDVDTRNLDRFAERAVTFDTHYAGSLPCMPARREWLAGVREFLWRPWGPMEPFDDPLPRLARDRGIVTQLITDHYHYFQHGSHGYYEDFNGFEFVRGHEFDAWRTAPADPPERLVSQSVTPGADPDPRDVAFMHRPQYARNVADVDELDERDFFVPQVFSRTAEWLGENREWDRWFCYVDSFDVHEPFHCPEPYASMYTDEDPTDPDLPFWPFYGRTDAGQSELSERELAFVRSQFAGKATMVDRWFGRVLDRLDREGLWEETMVVVTSDHGHYLGEHGWVGKPGAPLYDVLAHTPLFVWHPDAPSGGRVDALTSAVDLYATVLEALDAPVPDDTHSRSLLPLVLGEATDHRDWALYGYWGSTVNVTDGRYTYLHPPDPDVDAHCHSTGMMNPRRWFTPRSGQPDAESGDFLPYADVPVWRYEGATHARHEEPMLFDTDADPAQETDLAGEGHPAETRLREGLVAAMDRLDAPAREYERLGLDRADA
ncbi:MAG: sulfatase-like hydrolase/transferase [Halorientalis sp.]